MDPLTRCASSSASDLAGLISGEADATSLDANSSFGTVGLRTPEPQSAASAAAAKDNEGADTISALTTPRLGHPDSVTDSLCRASDASTSEFTLCDDDSRDATLLSDCLRRILHLDGLVDASVTATAAATIGVADCCVYANCNCRSLPPPPSPSSAKPDTPIAAVAGRVSAGSSGCHCCCVS